MPGMTDTLENSVLNWLRGTAFPAAPSGLWLALFTVAPGDDGTGGTEVSTSSTAYARQPLTLTAAPSPVTNTADLAWPQASGDWGTLVAAAAVTSASAALSSSNVLWVFDLPARQNVRSTNYYSIPAGQLTLTLD